MLKRTKGFVSLVAAIALMLGLCSCSGKPETDPSTTADPTGIGAQAETGENTTAKDIVPESAHRKPPQRKQTLPKKQAPPRRRKRRQRKQMRQIQMSAPPDSSGPCPAIHSFPLRTALSISA